MISSCFVPVRIFRWRSGCLSIFLAGLGILSLHAEPAGRTALVIGNARYESAVGALRNTGNDARAVAKALRELNFEVIERHDVNRDQLLRAMGEFCQTLKGAEVGVFYYAGHGISVAGSNYLIPLKSGFEAGTGDEVAVRLSAETRLFNAEQAVADMIMAGATCNLVILDACRTNPLARNPRNRSVTARGGLEEMTPPAGSLIAFSTDAGRVAYDGDGTNGLYTEELVKNLRTPGLTIEQVFKRTRAAVLQRSGGGQLPAEYSRLIGEDVFLAGPAQAIPPSLPVSDASPKDLSSATPSEERKTQTLPELTALAERGQAMECLEGLQHMAETTGPGEFAVKPLEIVLEKVKNDLKAAEGPSAKVVVAERICTEVLETVAECLPVHPKAAELKAKAFNRQGDALLLLGQPDQALKAFDEAVQLTPDDPYIFYNRGRANRILGRMAEARADFLIAADPKFDKPMARRLANEALAELPKE